MNDCLKQIGVSQRLKNMKASSAQFFRMILVTVGMLLTLSMLGCKSNQSLSSSKTAAKRLDQLYRAYLADDLDLARQSMLESAAILETHPFPKPSASAHGLWLTYSRLFVLESTAGNDAMADAYLIKARYWLLRRSELTGDPEEKAVETADGVTAEKCTELVHKWDNDFTGGKGPRYMREQ
jgi:hypothetical protein